MIDFYAGEEKYVYAEIFPKKKSEVVVITYADYVLKNRDGEIVDSGICEIDGRELSAFLSMQTKGSYKLVMTARVGAEKVKANTIINVREE